MVGSKWIASLTSTLKIKSIMFSWTGEKNQIFSPTWESFSLQKNSLFFILILLPLYTMTYT